MARDDRYDPEGRNRDVYDEQDEPTEELRYEGPITLDEEDDVRDGSSGSRTLLTAAIVFGAVIVLVAIGLWLRAGTDDTIDDSALFEQRAAAAEEIPAPADERSVLSDEEPGGLPAEGEDRIESADVDFRPLPDDEPEPLEPETDVAAAPAVERPAPREARSVTASGGGVAELVTSGRLAEATDRSSSRWAGAPGNWTLQVLFACQEGTVQRAFTQVADDRLGVLPASHEDRSCWRLVWDTYPSRSAAIGGTSDVPAYFRDAGKPTPQRVDQVLN
jgi:septal ring-binding cell division protein DamX